MELFAGIEAGGTKFICAVGKSSGNIEKSITVPTKTPEETMPQVVEFFQEINKETPISAIGISSFGPLDPEPESPHFGYITTTPKLPWQHFDFVGTMKKAIDVPVGFDTDVNGAALGEHRWGQGQGLHTFLYVTVGTGIGAGGMMGGKMMHGLIHPEMGHMFIPQDIERDSFAGVCPYHGNCLEGLATGPSLMKRWNVKSPLDLPEDHEAWVLEAHYLSLAVANLVLCISPQRVIMGGGVMRQKQLLPLIRPKVQSILNGYVKHDSILKDIDNYIVAPGLGEESGICGALALAEKSYQESLF